MSDEWEWLTRRKFRFSSWKYFLLGIKIFFIPQPWPRGQRRESWWAWLSDWGLVGLGPVWVRSPFHPSAHGWLSLTGMTISPPNHQPVRYTQSKALQSYNGEIAASFNGWKMDTFHPQFQRNLSLLPILLHNNALELIYRSSKSSPWAWAHVTSVLGQMLPRNILPR